jgi:hypothetical protein
MREPVVFFWGGRGGLDGRFSFSLLCSQCVPMGFLKFPRRSQKHLSFVSYGLPKFNSPVYELKRYAIRGPHLFLISKGGGVQRGTSIGECPMF